MKVYNINKTQILEDYDLNKGYLKEDVIVIHHDEIKEVKEVGHYEVKQVYPNGGKDVEWVVDIEGQEYTPAYTEEEKIKIYIPYTENELLEHEKNFLRNKRKNDCFTIINRGKLWYDKLTNFQLEELDKWYQDWLNVTDTLEEPIKPSWLK